MHSRIHDLALPLAFRSRGGFGTHWMFPGSIVIANPRRVAGWICGLPADLHIAERRRLVDSIRAAP